jgi:hypothetical protein
MLSAPMLISRSAILVLTTSSVMITGSKNAIFSCTGNASYVYLFGSEKTLELSVFLLQICGILSLRK